MDQDEDRGGRAGAHEDGDEGSGPAFLRGRHPLAMVYGGGGVVGIAYTAGVAAGLRDAGIDVASAPALGTSAGSWTASALALDLDLTVMLDVQPPSVPNLRPGLLVAIARELFGDARHPLVAVSALCVCGRRREVLDGAVHPLADLVAASSAVPGLLPPHRIEGRVYLDGGMWSATSVDAAPVADRVVVVAPIAGPLLGAMGRAAEFLLARELGSWRRAHPDTEIVVIRPGEEVARLAGTNPLGLFDAARARRVAPLAYAEGLEWGARLNDRPAA